MEFKLVKCVLFSRTPSKFYSLFRECIEWDGEFQKVLYKGAIVVTETQEGSYPFDCSWHRPISDPHNFDWVHAGLSSLEDKAQVFHAGGMEDTFLWLEV